MNNIYMYLYLELIFVHWQLTPSVSSQALVGHQCATIDNVNFRVNIVHKLFTEQQFNSKQA